MILMKKEREFGIDLLKFLAVLLVVNSHMDVCYPGRWSVLATGGAIGDALFFFCSGYTLFLGRADGFLTWFKRRLWRVLPATLLCVAFFAGVYGSSWWGHTGGYWFIRCILTYYIVIYAVRKTLMDRIGFVFAAVVLAVLIWFYGFDRWTESIYANGYFMWLHYFVPMLMGAVLGSRKRRVMELRWSVPMFFVCLAAFYAGNYLTSRQGLGQYFRILTLPLLWGIVYYLNEMARTTFAKRFLGETYFRVVIMTIGGLCLEVYLIHRPFVTDLLNGVFPLNIPFLFGLILISAYLLRCVSRIVVQLFQKKSPVDWREVIRIV